MAVSKRIRFEILRRDQHTCRYCRSTDNPLTVDHVIPVALGGTDTPDNLVAACRDCNAGKSSAAPDSSLIDDVREDAIRHAEMIKQAYAVLVERLGRRDDYIDEFNAAYNYRLPDDYQASIGRWFDMGVPLEIVLHAAQRACSLLREFQGTDRFRYMCGIVWNQVHAVNETVATQQAIAGAFMTEDSLDNLRQESYEMGCGRGMDLALGCAWHTSVNPVAAFVDNHRKGIPSISTRGISGSEFEALDINDPWAA